MYNQFDPFRHICHLLLPRSRIIDGDLHQQHSMKTTAFSKQRPPFYTLPLLLQAVLDNKMSLIVNNTGLPCYFKQQVTVRRHKIQNPLRPILFYNLSIKSTVPCFSSVVNESFKTFARSFRLSLFFRQHVNSLILHPGHL